MLDDILGPEQLADVRQVPAESLVGDVSLWNPPTPPRTPREALEAAIAAAIDLLDLAEPDPDLEPDLAGSNNGHYPIDVEGPDVDLEPALGAPEIINQEHAWKRGGPDHADEPSLGSIGSCYGQSIPQTDWAGGGVLDLEDEHDGCEPDEADEEGPMFRAAFASAVLCGQSQLWRSSNVDRCRRRVQKRCSW